MLHSIQSAVDDAKSRIVDISILEVMAVNIQKVIVVWMQFTQRPVQEQPPDLSWA
jgi:hypothetical protein